MEKKQSSIEWLSEEIDNMISFIDIETSINFKRIVEQAKAMHKYEILETFEKGYVCGYRDNGDGGIDYYNETFGGQDNE